MPDLSTDEAAILAVIHANRIAVWTQDFDAYEKCFVHAPYTARWNASSVSGILVRQGWDEIAGRVKEMFANYRIDGDPDAARANAYDTEVVDLNIRISGDIAWATFRQKYPAVSPPAGGAPARAWYHAGASPSHEMRVFERRDGQWRIAFLCFLDPDTSRSYAPLLRLGPDGRVEWQSDAATAILADEDDLVVRNGRLRVRDAKTDERLQAAIAWAAKLAKPFIHPRGALPIVMHAGEGLPTKVWWVVVESGQILFSLGDPQQDVQRLEAAAVVYGLSSAQREVAGHILAGRSLAEAAAAMGITLNTARTHLDRMFVKTGVHTQAALVRALLSATAPI